MQWLMKRAGEKWGTEEVNRALRNVISRHEWAAYWHHRSIENDTGYCPAIKALRDAKLWVPAEKEERHLTKYLKHPEWLTWEEHMRLLIYAKELKPVPKKKITQYREIAYRLWGVSRVKWARRKPQGAAQATGAG
jgi:hypothetical protein